MPEIFLPPVASHTTGGFFMLRSRRILADGKAVPKLSSQMEEVLHSVEDHPRRNRREKQPRQAGDDGDTPPLKRQVPSSPPGARELKTGICRPYSNSRVSLSAVHCRCMALPPLWREKLRRCPAAHLFPDAENPFYGFEFSVSIQGIGFKIGPFRPFVPA